MTCRKEIKFKCHCNIDDIYTHCERVKKIDIFRVIYVERNESLITLVHKPDFVSNGEKVYLRLEELEDGVTGISAVSESLTPLRMFDWGRNATNLAILKSYFSNLAQKINSEKTV